MKAQQPPGSSLKLGNGISMGLLATFRQNPWRDERVCKEFGPVLGARFTWEQEEVPPCRADHPKLLRSGGRGAVLRALDLIHTGRGGRDFIQRMTFLGEALGKGWSVQQGSSPNTRAPN